MNDLNLYWYQLEYRGLSSLCELPFLNQYEGKVLNLKPLSITLLAFSYISFLILQNKFNSRLAWIKPPKKNQQKNIRRTYNPSIKKKKIAEIFRSKLVLISQEELCWWNMHNIAHSNPLSETLVSGIWSWGG